MSAGVIAKRSPQPNALWAPGLPLVHYSHSWTFSALDHGVSNTI